MERFILVFYISLVRHAKCSILSGENAKVIDYPYQAYVLPSNTAALCGASIIHKRWLLTAAHCDFTMNNTHRAFVAVGGDKVFSFETDYYEIENFICHYGWDLNSLYHDIALVRVKNDIRFNSKIKSIELPRNNFNKYRNNLAVLTGFGKPSCKTRKRPSELRFMKARIIGQNECSKYHRFIKDNHICTSNFGGQEIGAGDSGGPVVVGQVQVGVVSMGSCVFGVPNVNTRVSFFLPWIKYQLNLYLDKLPYKGT